MTLNNQNNDTHHFIAKNKQFKNFSIFQKRNSNVPPASVSTPGNLYFLKSAIFKD